MLDNGYTREEMKMVWETQKIFEDPHVLVNATAVRVPVFYGHSEAVHLETRDFIEIDEVRRLLREAPGVELVEGQGMIHATPVTHAAGKDPVFVSRLRRDLSHPCGISMWVVADNIRKGAALNAVQIMERLEQNRAAGGNVAAANVHSA
jgi:aspartate-semialdehyde dehydrogenase